MATSRNHTERVMWRIQRTDAMTPNTLYPPKVVSRDDRLAVLHAADWLSLAAAPTFAFMAALTGIIGGGAHEMLCSSASNMSVLCGMVPMYVLMSVFHSASWLKLVSRWRSGARAAGRTDEGNIYPPLAE